MFRKKIFLFLFILILFCLYSFFKKINLNHEKIFEKYGNHEKFFYIHIPKTAGSFLENFFKKKEIQIGRYNHDYENEKPDINCSFYHIPPYYFKSIDFSKYLTFTCIRNPLERFISEFNYQNEYFGKNMKFSTFMQRLPPSPEELVYFDDCHFIPQYLYLYDSFLHECKYILRFEHLFHDLQWFCKQFNITINESENKKYFESKKKFSITDLSSEDKGKILSYYKKDYQLWKKVSAKVIYVYLPKKEQSERKTLCYLSWKIMNPTWIFVELNPSNLSQYIQNKVYLNNIKQYENSSIYPFLISIQLLKEEGGLWVNLDTFCIVPLEKWFKSKRVFPIYFISRKNYIDPSVNIMYSEKEEPFFHDYTEKIKKILYSNKKIEKNNFMDIFDEMNEKIKNNILEDDGFLNFQKNYNFSKKNNLCILKKKSNLSKEKNLLIKKSKYLKI